MSLEIENHENPEDADKVLKGFYAFESSKKVQDLVPAIRLCRERGLTRIAFGLAKLAQETQEDVKDRTDTAWGDLDYELTICAWYAKQNNVGLQASNRIMLLRNVPEWAQSSVHANLEFYMPLLEPASHTELTWPLLPADMRLLNPGICKIGDDIHINVRMVNSGGDWFTLNNGQPVTDATPIRTVNWRVSWPGREFRAWECKHNVQSYGGSVLGLEDLRLFDYKGRVWFMAVAQEFASPRQNKMFLGHDNFGVVIESPTGNNVEKNWSPFHYEGRLLAIYSCDPLRILEINSETGQTKTIFYRANHLPLHMDSFRGSAPPIHLSDDQSVYFIIHEVIWVNHKRVYFNRIVRMAIHEDSSGLSFEITHLSMPFKMQREHRVEYVSGWTRHGNSVLISWGDNDQAAMITEVPVTRIQELCIPLAAHRDALP